MRVNTAVLAALILAALVAGGAVTYVLINNQPSTVTTTVTTTATTTVTTTSSVTQGQNQTQQPTNYGELLKEVVYKISELRTRGYDVLLAEYYVLSAKYLWSTGERDAAVNALMKASEIIQNPQPLPEVKEPAINFRVVPSVTDVNRVPSTWDFVPLGKVFVLTKEGYLEYPRNDYVAWELSCFILAAIGRDSEGHLVLYQGRLPMKPEENPFKPKVYVNGEWYVPNIVFAGPLYYKSGPGYVEVYEYDLSGKYVETLTYVPSNRTWIHTLSRVGGETILRMVAHGEGVPMWLGEWGKTFMIHGAYPKDKAFDLWAGFWDVGPMSATLNVRGREVRITGYLVVDRASHRRLPINESERRFAGGAPLAFSCMVVRQGEDVTVMVTDTHVPKPLNPPTHPEHQVRINVPYLNFTAITTNFTLTDNGGLQPSEFRLVAWFDGGYVNLTGKALVYWPPRWATGKGTWWRSDAGFSWGRAFIKWEGVVVIHGGNPKKNAVIKVNALGVGEFTRYSIAAPCGTNTCPEGGGCWCTTTMPWG